MKKALALVTLIGLFTAFGCSGASEGNTSQAAEELRKEIPATKTPALPEDKEANVFGRTPIDGSGGGKK